MTNLELDNKYLHFVGLGGCNQIGMNLNVFAYKNEVICVDIGISFFKRLGIDVIMPSVEYLKSKKITGIFITHAHADHIGATIYLCKNMNAPIFMTEFSMEVFQSEVGNPSDINCIYDWDYNSEIPIKKGKFNIVVVDPGKRIKSGVFSVEYIRTAHSIVESHMLLIKTEKNTILHTGDWKLDYTPVVSYKTDEKRLREIGITEKVDAITCDSTNAVEEGRTPSESWVRENIIKCVGKHKKRRIIASCFSSHIDRIRSFIDGAELHGMKVYAVGRSVVKNITAAQKLGYIKVDSVEILPNYNKIPSGHCVVICTGSQGETSSVLYKVAYSTRSIINKNDVVIFSARPIPGNELEINNMKSMLVKKGALLLDSKSEHLHTSGHACKEDIKDLISWINPMSFIPVHGDCYHIHANAQIAAEMKIPSVICSNGSVVRIDGANTKIIGTVTNGTLGLDGNRIINMNALFLKDREKLGTDGVIIISVHLKNQTVNSLPYGVIDTQRVQNTKLCSDVLEKELRKNLFQDNISEDVIVGIVKQTTREFFFRYFKKDPVVIVSINS